MGGGSLVAPVPGPTRFFLTVGGRHSKKMSIIIVFPHPTPPGLRWVG